MFGIITGLEVIIMACPLCRSTKFYIKDTEDEYETYDFELKQGQVCFEDELDTAEAPEVTEDCEVFCQRCAWHGPLEKVDKD